MATTGDVLATLKRNELEDTAKNLKVDYAKLNDQQLIVAITRAAVKLQIEVENQARAELRAESAAKSGRNPNAKKRPSPQDVAIKNCRRVVVEFHNQESPATNQEDGADLPFTVGTYTFHLWDGLRFVMPECIVTSRPLDDKKLMTTLTKFWISCGLDIDAAKLRTVTDLVLMSLARRCVNPVFKQGKDPHTGHVVSQRCKDIPRFRFTIIGPAQEGALLGSVVEPDPSENMTDEELIQEALT